jgi:hypothetical protein
MPHLPERLGGVIANSDIDVNAKRAAMVVRCAAASPC